MSYSIEIIEKAKEVMQERRQRREDERSLNLALAYKRAPELMDIDRELSSVGIKIFGVALQGKEGLEEKIEKLKAENLLLQEQRGEILKSHGLSPDFTDLKYDCEKCNDTGYVGVKMCSCFKNALVSIQLQESGIGTLTESQSFESFSFDMYPEDERENVEKIVSVLKQFSLNFGNEYKNLLLVGGTGLGKTHLSTAVAKSVIERGFSVVYETAANMFTDFEDDRFRDRINGEEKKSTKYMECDLLIIDDLGTEVISNFTVSCLYNIINTRINKRLPIIFNTNLNSQDIRSRYNDRITSRLFGEFMILAISGTDIRRRKISPN